MLSSKKKKKNVVIIAITNRPRDGYASTSFIYDNILTSMLRLIDK